MPKQKKAPAKTVALDKFVTHWTKAKSLAQVSKWTGLSAKGASIKASLLRTKGVNLKKFEAPVVAEAPKVWTVSALNSLIKEVSNGTSKTTTKSSAPPAPGKKKLGRPKGSKNKPKEADGVGMVTAMESPEPNEYDDPGNPGIEGSDQEDDLDKEIAERLAAKADETAPEPTNEELAAFNKRFPMAASAENSH
jgi:hypothetical protein